jgi:hypothetical protein
MELFGRREMKLTQTQQLILDALAGGARLGRIQGSFTGYLLIWPPPKGTSRKCQRGTLENLMSMGLLEDPPPNGLTALGLQRANRYRFQ